MMQTSDFIAGLALVVSVIALAYQIYINRNMMERDLYADVFKEYLMVRIPEARNQLKLVNGRLTSQKLQKCLSDLRRDILYFKFYNSTFYKALDKIILEIDDLVVSINNESDMNSQREMMRRIDPLINSLYDEISRVYVNGNH